MDINAYIESGILELYVAGTLSEKENKEVYMLMQQHPEIQKEVLEIEASIVKLTASIAPKSTNTFQTIKSQLGLNISETKVVSIAKYNWFTYTGWAASILLAAGLFWALNLNNQLQTKIQEASSIVPENQRLILNIAVNYGGQWDILQAAKQCCEKVLESPDLLPHLGADEFASHLSLGEQPAVDILIRTGGEHRISNFLLWQSAYAEIFFEDVLWPDFDENHLQSVVERFLNRERRFGQTSEQVNA